jgi:hypothetical protein
MFADPFHHSHWQSGQISIKTVINDTLQVSVTHTEPAARFAARDSFCRIEHTRLGSRTITRTGRGACRYRQDMHHSVAKTKQTLKEDQKWRESS